MSPWCRNVVGHAGAAQAQVDALAIGEVLVQPNEETVRRDAELDGVQPVVGVTVGLGGVIGQRPQINVVSEQSALERQVFISRRAGSTRNIRL